MKKSTLLVFCCLVLQLQAQTFTNYTSSDGLIDGIISNIIQDSNGDFWFVDWSNSSNDGIGNFDGTNWQSFGTTDGTAGNSYQGMLEDATGDYWFGSFIFENGLDRYDGTNWINYTTADGLAGNSVGDIIIGNDGNIWMVCSGATSGLTTYDGVSFTSVPADGTTLPLASLRRLAQAVDDTFWMATFDGVIAYDGVDSIQYTTSDGLSSNEIEDIFVDSNGIVWAGTDIASGGGLNRFDGTSWTVFTTADGLPEDSIRAIFEDSNGDLWFGTNVGVSKYDGTTFTNYDTSDGLIEDHVRAIIEDDQGNLWFGTWGGVSKFDPTLGIFDTLRTPFVLYPNPADDRISIQSEANIKSVTIHSLLGQRILEQTGDALKYIDVSTLSQGTYIAVVSNVQGEIGFQKVSIK